MFIRFAGSALCFMMLLAGCDSKSADSQNPAQANAPQTATPTSVATANPASSPGMAISSASPPSAPGLLNACELIDKSEIATVQGAQVQSTMPNSQTKGDLVTSQCYYTVVSAKGSQNLSVHLQVTKADPKNPKAVKEYWEKAFHEKDEQGEKEKEKEAVPPQSIAGIGEEAFWVADAKIGVLYALKNGSLVRLSVGGPDSIKIRLGKAKTLMAKALKRIS